jgi:hypothetical protein
LFFCLYSDSRQGHCQICLSSVNFQCDKCLICVYCHAAFPTLPLLCPPAELPFELNVHEQGEQPCGGLGSVPGQDHRAVPPWIAPAAGEQQAGASHAEAEFGGGSSTEDSAEINYSAAAALSEWSVTGEAVDADPEQSLITLEDSDSSSEDETARDDTVAAEIVAEAGAHVAEAARWAEGHDCISHTQPCHLGCWNGLDPVELANSETGVAAHGDEDVPTKEEVAQTKADAAYMAAINWNDEVYADTVATDEKPAVWSDIEVVKIVYMESPSVLYLCKLSDVHAYNEFLSAVNVSGHSSAPLVNPAVGQPCLVWVSNFGQRLRIGGLEGWRRAVIAAVNPSLVTVTLMDFGMEITVQHCMWMLRKLRRDLCHIPSRLRRVYAPSVVPFVGTVWSLDDQRFIREFVLEREVFTLKSGKDVAFSLDNGLEFFSTLASFKKLSFSHPRLPIVVSPPLE